MYRWQLISDLHWGVLMRPTAIVIVSLLSLYKPAMAHPWSDFQWSIPEYDANALIACQSMDETPGCQTRLYPCETAFNLPPGANLAALPIEIRHDLTACFMAQYDHYEDALWNVAPGSAPDPALSRNMRMELRHHRNAFGECWSSQKEKTEDWRCAAQEILFRLLEMEVKSK